MANETPNRVHAGGVFVPVVAPPFTTSLLAQQGVQAFTRTGPGQYLLTLQQPLAFSEGYAQAGIPANFQAVAGAQLSPDGTQVLVTVLDLATGSPIDPPIVYCTVWAAREGEGAGPVLPLPPIPAPLPAGFPGFGGAPPNVATASAAGVATLASRSDHTHGHGAQPLGDGSNHAPATTTFAGFMSAIDKAKLDALTTAKSMWFPAETNAQNASHRVRNIGAAGNFDFDFAVPYDFTTLLGIEMWGASRTVTNAAASITVTSSYGVPPADPEDTQVGVGILEAFTANQLFTYSIAGAFAGLVAGAQAAVNILHNGIGGSLDYYGIYMAYE